MNSNPLVSSRQVVSNTRALSSRKLDSSPENSRKAVSSTHFRSSPENSRKAVSSTHFRSSPENSTHFRSNFGSNFGSNPENSTHFRSSPENSRKAVSNMRAESNRKVVSSNYFDRCSGRYFQSSKCSDYTPQCLDRSP